jgi:hypothetical protein
LKDSAYFKQAELMLRMIPHVAAETCFALKGGTARDATVIGGHRSGVLAAKLTT